MSMEILIYIGAHAFTYIPRNNWNVDTANENQL